MSDPAAARTEAHAPGEAPSGPDAPARPGRLAAIVALARPALIATALLTAYYLLPLDRTGTVLTSLVLAGGLLAVTAVFAWEVRTIVRSPYPRLKAVEALATTVVLFLVLFSCAYYLLEHHAAGSFSEPLTRTDALYFTLTTFTTVGYGDIAARSQAGRVVTMLQMVGGLLLFGVAARILAEAVQAGLRRKVEQAAGRGEGGGEREGPP
ncbi:metal transporter [Streptomyces sp. Ru71]|uniref:potassium channel family protein n=1 Tax=Streptomyces sp. Ru71 TaxID=2080746 RepID=UPI000CDD9CED|nr:potassium channel family protein [Streptomyces sp. Ru71]POX54445.1 metal transporter [Streptomyces sp. Ru71]